MANYLITPNMQLPNPVPGVDPGPDYANNLSSSLNIIDQHNHSAGNGVLINPNGLNINADLSFNGNNATLLRSSRFSAQAMPLSLGTDLGCLYVSGVDLYYNDINGNQVQITASGAVNATSSGIVSGSASAAFAGGVLVVKSSSISGANVLLQSVELTNSGNLTNILTLQAPTLSGSASLTLPAVPASTSFMQVDNSGNMSASVAVSGGIGTSNLADGSVTNPKLAALGQQVSTACTSFSSTSSSITPITNLSVSITTTGRPVFIGLISANPSAFSSSALIVSRTTSGAAIADIFFIAGASTYLAVNQFAIEGAVDSVPIIQNALPPSAFSTIAVGLSAGTYTITAQAVVFNGMVEVSNTQLIAYEL